MDLKITAAANKQLSLICTQTNKNVRLQITSGGCQGFNKTWELSDTINVDDVVFTCETGRLIIDPASLDIISGAIIDYLSKVDGSFFTVEIPHATSTCGCGNSFNI